MFSRLGFREPKVGKPYPLPAIFMGKNLERAGIEVEEKMRFSAVLLERDMGHGRKLRKVVDTDTGEVIVKQNQGSIAHVFNTGANAVITEVMISKEETPGGSEHWFLKEPESGNLIADFWRNPEKLKSKNEKKPKHTGGKKSYVKVDAEALEKMSELNDADAGFLLKLARFADWHTGGLLDKRTKKPLDMSQLQQAMKYKSVNTLKARLKKLIEIEAITQDAEGRFFLSREFIQRG